MVKVINFDMDGTIANFYGVDGWLDYLMEENTLPYEVAKPLLNMSRLARILNMMQAEGWEINIISWGSKFANETFMEEITKAKMVWLDRHLHSVKFDHIFIVPYGTPKESLAKGFLFDDEERNRVNWGKDSFDVYEIIENLKMLRELE